MKTEKGIRANKNEDASYISVYLSLSLPFTLSTSPHVPGPPLPKCRLGRGGVWL